MAGSPAEQLLSGDFGYVLIAGAAICVHAVMQGGAVAAARRKVFGKDSTFRKSKEFKLLNAEHNEATKQDIDDNGYPDMGQGKYGQLLPMKDYLMINNAQRAHQNYLELLPSALFLLGSSGLFFPKISAGLGIVFLVGREMYAQGYRSDKGAPARYRGAFWAIGMFGLLAGTIAGSLGQLGVVPKLPSI